MITSPVFKTSVQPYHKYKLGIYSGIGHNTMASHGEAKTQAKRTELNTRLDLFSRLPNDWDGYGASSFSSQTIHNAKLFLESLEVKYLLMLDEESLTPNSHATIDIEWADANHTNLVCVEIGELNCAFYSRSQFGDFRFNDNFEVDSLPVELKNDLQMMYILSVLQYVNF